MKGNVLVVHGGGPTAVMNASLYGVLEETGKQRLEGKVYGAMGGCEGILKERFLDLSGIGKEMLDLLPSTPASAIGTSRYALEEQEYRTMAEILKRHEIRYVLLNGGNGTMDTCGRLCRACRDSGILVAGIPKTIDNDIAVTDHSPGYGSAARYIAAITAEVGADVKALPIHVCIIEAMGRNAGWITAASALARRQKGAAPHLIYLPERPFCEAQFLEDVTRLHREIGGVVVVASEGLKDESGAPIVPPIFRSGRAVYYGDVSAHLANLVIRKLGIKARSEKPGICGRASIAWQSPVDREEAIQAGRLALQAVLEGKSGVMPGFMREDTEDGSYKVRPELIPISQVMMHERKIPDSWINERGNDVTEEFVRWCRPLIGPRLPEFADFTDCLSRPNTPEGE